MDNHITQEELTQKASEANQLRKEYIKKLALGEITFDQLITFSEQEPLKALRKILLVDLLAQRPGWNEPTATYAFHFHGIPLDSKVSTCAYRPSIRKQVGSLLDSTSTRWQQRIPAQDGYPWHGLVLNHLKDLRKSPSLQHDVKNIVRYMIDYEGEILSEDYEYRENDIPQDAFEVSEKVDKTKDDSPKKDHKEQKEKALNKNDFINKFISKKQEDDIVDDGIHDQKYPDIDNLLSDEDEFSDNIDDLLSDEEPEYDDDLDDFFED